MFGTNLKREKTKTLNDVHEHDGYISCDSETVSEIAIPLFIYDDIVAVLDIESAVIDGFDQIDKSSLRNFYR